MNKKSQILLTAMIALSAVFALVSPVSAYGYDYDYDAVTTSAAEAASAGLFYGTTSILFFCCIFIFGFGINIALAYFVYRDAEKNKIENPILWAIIAFFFTLIGVLIYFLAIRPDALRRNEEKGIKPASSKSPVEKE